MWHPKYWKRVRFVNKMLADYPPYAPPYRSDQRFLPPQQAEDNMLYFFEQKPLRLRYLHRFLAKFGTEMGVDDAGVAAVSTWFPQYAGVLVNHLGTYATTWALFDFASPWTDELQGLNTVFDLGVYFGECVIARNRRLRWDVRVFDPPIQRPIGAAPGPGGSGFEIEGLETGWGAFDPIQIIWNTCCNIAVDYRWRLAPAPNFEWGDLRPDAFSRRVQDYATK